MEMRIKVIDQRLLSLAIKHSFCFCKFGIKIAFDEIGSTAVWIMSSIRNILFQIEWEKIRMTQVNKFILHAKRAEASKEELLGNATDSSAVEPSQDSSCEFGSLNSSIVS